MLSLRLVRRFGTLPRIVTSTVTSSFHNASSSIKNGHTENNGRKPIEVNEPALVKLKNEMDPDKLFNLFKSNAQNRVVVENRFAFEDTVSRLARAGRFDYIEDLLEHQKTLPQGRREGFMVRIIMLYGKAGMTKHAVNTFYDMHLHGCKRTVKSFNAALKVLAESRDLDAIESFIWDAPSRFGFDLDVFSLNIAIKVLCDMHDLDKASLVMVEMEKLRICPDVITYTTLIAAFYKANRWEIANGIWNLMVLKGCRPNVASFNVRIQFLVSKGDAWEASKLLAWMRHHSNPDEVTYNLVIKGFCRVGYLEMAYRVYSAFLSEGRKPNQKIYQTMIHYLCGAGKFDEAYTMCKASMQKKFFPSIDTLSSLLKGLRKDGRLDKLEKAKYIYSLALKRVPPFSAGHINTMKSILSRRVG